MGVHKSISCDNEGAFVSNKDNNVKRISTNGHARVAERQIQTIKNMMYQRIEKTSQTWRE